MGTTEIARVGITNFDKLKKKLIFYVTFWSFLVSNILRAFSIYDKFLIFGGSIPRLKAWGMLH
jgi:hypothetical protein